MSLNEYGSIFSLVVFLYLLIPAVIMGIMEKKIKYYGILISLPVIFMLTGGMKFRVLVGFLFFEYLLIYLYYRFKDRFNSEYYYLGILIVSILPMVYAKSAYLTHLHTLEIFGMSYLCFRLWQIIIEIHDGHIKRINPFDLFYFTTFFPTLSSGPIDRYKRFIEECNSKISKSVYINEYLLVGIKKLFYGIVYKFGIANLINLYVLIRIPNELTFINAIKYMYTYTFYLFFDFAGYSFLAIGTGYLLGIKVPENFNKPFLAKNMKEFWERWHMSLSKWFGDFLFSRVVLNLIRNKVVSKQTTATKIGYLVTMTTMGIWHGFTVYYILYGVYQGVALLLTDMYVKSKSYRKHIKKPYYTIVSRFICFQIVAFGMLLFSGYLIRF